MSATVAKKFEASSCGSVRADEILTLTELRRRFAWEEHSVRKAKAAGLRFVRFGRQKFVFGSDVIKFFRQLGEGNGDG